MSQSKPENKEEKPSGNFKKPSRHINLIVIGMAGSGKTTFMGVIAQNIIFLEFLQLLA